MFLKYLGKTPNFVYKGVDFSKGPAEVDDAIGKLWRAESPKSFMQVVPVEPVAAKITPKKPVLKPAK